MGKAYIPPLYNVPLKLLTPSHNTVKGVLVKAYPKPNDGILFYGSFKTYGGTETTTNGIYAVHDTASIETWYRPDIKADCRIFIPSTGEIYEVIGKPENINMRNQHMKFKVKCVQGGA